MIYAFVCPREFAYRYRTPELPADTTPQPEDFEAVNGQTTPPEAGKKAVCDLCGADLRAVKLPDQSAYDRPVAASQSVNGSQVRRISVAPAGGAVAEIFKAEANEDVKDIRDLVGGRLLVVTSRRIVVVDPNLVPTETV